MNIATTRWLHASNKSALWVACRRHWQLGRLYSQLDRPDVPPHLEPPAPVPAPAAQPEEFLTRHEHNVKPYYITTPIFYPNAVPHIGHLYSLVVADIFARHARLEMPMRPVHFITGTDEHGLKIQKVAQERNIEPQELCDRLGVAFSGLAQQANISHTRFIRTSEEEHYRGVQTLWDELVKSGHIYSGEHSGWYSISDECFYTESQIRSHIDPKTAVEVKVSAETGNVVEWTKEQNYKFTLSKFRSSLLKHFEANPSAIYPPTQRKEIMDLLASQDSKALPDLSVSRPSSRLKWGIPVPGDPSQTIYVWLDALSSYLTGIGYPWIDSTDMVANGWPVDLQIIGKDILKFHAIYFPAFLMALKMPVPRALLSHAHWTVNKAKMSKSVGNVVDPVAVLRNHGVDAVRWYLARTGGYFKTDVDWNDDQLLKTTAELRSLLGNILLRLQSRKILDRLPIAFNEVPLHRGILITRGNARAPLSEPGSREYDDELEDRRYRYEASLYDKSGVDYAKEYAARLANSDTGVSRGPPPNRTSQIIWYSEVPDPGLGSAEEALIVSSELRDNLDMLRGKVSYHLKRYEVGDATQSIVDVLTLLNKEITRIQPWSTETQPRDIIHILVWARETLRICGILLQPFLPVASQGLLDAMHVHSRARTYGYACIGAGQVRTGPLERRVLFPSADQREWGDIESDHKWDENKKKKNAQQSEKLPKNLYIRKKLECNNLYSQHFNPYGSRFSPNGKRRRKRTRQNAPSLETFPETDETAKDETVEDQERDISWYGDRKKFLELQYGIKAEKQKKRESI